MQNEMLSSTRHQGMLWERSQSLDGAQSLCWELPLKSPWLELVQSYPLESADFMEPKHSAGNSIPTASFPRPPRRQPTCPASQAPSLPMLLALRQLPREHSIRATEPGTEIFEKLHFGASKPDSVWMGPSRRESHTQHLAPIWNQHFLQKVKYSQDGSCGSRTALPTATWAQQRGPSAQPSPSASVLPAASR